MTNPTRNTTLLWQLSGDFYAGAIETGTETLIDLQTYREQRGGVPGGLAGALPEVSLSEGDA